MPVPATRWIAILLLAGSLFPLACNGADPGAELGPAISRRTTATPARVDFVTLERQEGGWLVSVTVSHADLGWEHYADWWRITDDRGSELARRVLRHPHLDEQPFTRSLANVSFPGGLRFPVVEAHCLVDGYGGRTVRIDLTRDEGPGYRIIR